MSESHSIEDIAKPLISGLRDLATSRYVSVSGYAVLLYDHILTFSIEVEVIWHKPKGFVSYAFLFNRYGVPIFVALDIWQIIGTAQNVPDRFCHDWLYVEAILQIVCHGIAHWLAAFRVRALHLGRPWVDLIIYASGTVYMVATVIVLSLVLVDVAKTYSWNTTLNMCFWEFPRWMYWCWVPALLFEVILFSLIVVRAVGDWRRDIAFPLTRLLYRDGFIYFVVIAACNVFNIIVWSALPSTMVALAKYFGFSMMAVMSSRIVLNLRMLWQRPSGTEGVQTDTAFELGALGLAQKSRMSGHHVPKNRMSSDPSTQPSWSQSDTNPVRPSHQWKRGRSEDSGRLQASSPSIEILVNVHREIEIDELDENDSDYPRYKGSGRISNP